MTNVNGINVDQDRYIAATLVYNTPDLTKRMLNQMPSILIMDNGSTRNIMPVEEDAEGTFCCWQDNLLFSGGWNYAVELIQAFYPDVEYVWMLNSDIEGVSEAMLAELVYHMHCANNMGARLAAITPAFNSPHSVFHPRPTMGDPIRRTKWVDWCGPLLSLEAWKVVGPFDADNFSGYGADIDWCKRARDRAYTFGVVDAIRFHHMGSITAAQEGMVPTMCNTEAMDQAMLKKWNQHWWEMI